MGRQNNLNILFRFKILDPETLVVWKIFNCHGGIIGSSLFGNGWLVVLTSLVTMKKRFTSRLAFAHLTLTRPIGLPPHAPVVQKTADRR